MFNSYDKHQELIHTELLNNLQALLEMLADEPLSESTQVIAQELEETLRTRQRVIIPDDVVYHELCGLLYATYNSAEAGEPRSVVREKYTHARRAFEIVGYSADDVEAAKAYAERHGYNFHLDDYL